MMIADELETLIESAYPRLTALTPPATTPSGSWSHHQVIGHLIDSAANNHQRFVRLQVEAVLDFPPYQQNHWVSSQHYASRDWRALLELWRSYNLHLAWVMRHIPPGALRNVWRAPRGDLTLEFLMVDYVEHLRHHLASLQ